MRAGRSWPLAAALIVVLAFAAPAAAHESGLGSSWLTEAAHHPGWYWPSTSGQTSNFEMVGSVGRTRADSTYRNSDLAFWGRLAFAGHYDGFQIVDVGQPAQAEAARRLHVPGLAARRLGLAGPAVRLGRDAALEPGVRLGAAVPGLRGHPHLRRLQPAFAGADRGGADRLRLAHPHAGARPAPTTACCSTSPRTRRSASSRRRAMATSASAGTCPRRDDAGRPAHNKISVVEVPLRDPRRREGRQRAALPAEDLPHGWTGCHDITVFMELEIAGAACMGEGQIWDISDLENPRTTGRVFNPTSSSGTRRRSPTTAAA